jgi:hypothetical protein
MNTRRIASKVERSSLGTARARAARRSISPAAAAKVVARAEVERERDERPPTKSGGSRCAATYT